MLCGSGNPGPARVSGAEFVLDGGGDGFGVMSYAVEGGAFDHDAGQGFGAGKADDDAADFAKLFVAGTDGGLDGV